MRLATYYYQDDAVEVDIQMKRWEGYKLYDAEDNYGHEVHFGNVYPTWDAVEQFWKDQGWLPAS